MQRASEWLYVAAMVAGVTCALAAGACSAGSGDGDGTDASAGSVDAEPGSSADAGPQVDYDAAPVPTLSIPHLDRYVVLGDSLSVGAYPDILYADLQSAFPGIDRVHRGESGSQIEDVLNDQIPGLQQHSGAVLVTLTIGGNDFKSSPAQVMSEALSVPAADQFRVDLDQALDALEQKFPGDLYVLLANIHDPTDDEAAVYDRAGLNGDVCDLLFLIEDLGAAQVAISNLGYWNQQHAGAAAARSTAYLADLHDTFLGHGLNAEEPSITHYDASDPTRWLTNDCAHPNSRGDGELADMFWQMVE